MSFHLIIPFFLSLKALIFCPPAAIGPSIHGPCLTIAIAGIESGIDSGLDKIYGWRGDSVFQRCIGANAENFYEMTFVYTLSVFLSCSDKPEKNLQALFEEADILCSEVAKNSTGCDPHAVMQIAPLDGCLLKKETEQPCSGHKNVEDRLDLPALCSSVRAVATAR